MFKSVQPLLVTSLASFLLVSAATANELKVKPGLWKTKTTVSNSMMNQTQTHEDTECITEEKSTLTPKTMLQDMGEECQLLESKIENNSMTYKIACNTEAGELKGEGKIESKTTSAQGNVNMSMNIMGQQVSMSMVFITERIGECKAEEKS